MGANDSHVIRVLLVEDSPLDARTVELSLRHANPQGYNITTTPTMAQAIEHLDTVDTDVVLLDLQLPDSWGIDTSELND